MVVPLRLSLAVRMRLLPQERVLRSSVSQKWE